MTEAEFFTSDEVMSIVKMLYQKYRYAVRQKWIHCPMAWALHETWREYDRMTKKDTVE